MAEHTQTRFRGLMIASALQTPTNLASGSATSYTEGSPQPGIPVPQQDTECVLITGGDQTAEALGADGGFDVACVRPGMPGRTGAQFGWKGRSDSGYRGWLTPCTPRWFETIEASSSHDYRMPHLLTLSDDKVLCVYQTITGSSLIGIQCRTMGEDGTWGSEVTVQSESWTDQWGSPCAVLVGTRILLFHLTNDYDDDKGQVRMWYSDDDGATWTKGSHHCLPADLDTSAGQRTPLKLRAAYKDGQVLLILHVDDDSDVQDDLLMQYASEDYGATFTLVHEQSGNGDSDGYVDIAVSDDHFVVAACDKSDSRYVVVWRLASAYDPITDANQTDLSVSLAMQCGTVDGSSRFTDGDVALTVDELGTLYMFCREGGSAFQISGAISNDGGVTWYWLQAVGDATIAPVSLQATTTYLWFLSACFHRGRVLIASTNQANVSTATENVSILHMGGFSSVTFPGGPHTVAVNGDTRGAVSCRWLPIDLPGDQGWTASGVAAVEALSGTDYLDLHTAANTRRYKVTHTSSVANGAIALAIARCTVGQVGLDIYTDDASNDYAASIELHPTTVELRNINGAAQLQQATGLTGGNTYALLLAVAGNKASAWYAELTSTDLEDLDWTLIGDDETLTDGGGTGVNEIGFGVITSATTESELVLEGHAFGEQVGTQPHIAEGFTNPTDLHGIALGATSRYMEDGCRVGAVDGPAFHADSWQIDARSDYPVENLHPQLSPSPARTWRSNQVALTETMEWKIDADNPIYQLSEIVGLYFQNMNCAYVQGLLDTDGGAPGGNFDARIPVTFTRKGSSVLLEYKSVGGEELVVYPNEFVGGAIQLGTGTGDPVRRITRNSGGTLQSSGTYKKPVCHLEGVVDGSDAASGNGYIWPTRFLVLLNLGQSAGTTDDFVHEVQVSYYSAASGLTADPPEGYFEAGVVMFGPVFVFGVDYDESRVITRSANVELRDAPDGSSQARKRGRTRRTVQLRWEGVDLKPLFDLSDDHVLASNDADVKPVAMRHDLPTLVDGLYDLTDGPLVPIVYLPRIRTFANADESELFKIQRCEGAIYGRIMGDLALTTRKGEEEADELVALGLTIREEV